MRSFNLSIAACLLVLCIHSELHAQVPPELINNPEFCPVARRAVDSLYNFNANAAWQLLAPWQKEYPDHPLWTLFKGIELWWQILSDLEDTSHDKQFFNLMGRADYESTQLLNRKRDHVDALIIKAISNGYIARQYANRDEWIQSINRSRKAYNAYQYLSEVEPNLPDLKLAEGLKLYYSELIPEKYPVVKTVSWFLPEGNEQKGLSLLKQAADSSIFAQAEARYFLGNINFNYEKNYPEAVRYLQQLYETYPDNNYYARILIRSYYQMDLFNKAQRVIDEILERWRRQNLPYKNILREELLTWKGRIMAKNFSYKEAIPVLKEAFDMGAELPSPESRSQHVISGYYLGSCYLETDNTKQAYYYLEAVIDMKTEKQYRDHARQLLEEDFN